MGWVKGKRQRVGGGDIEERRTESGRKGFKRFVVIAGHLSR